MKLMTLPPDDLEAMRACAAREAALRKAVYPKWIEAGRTTPAKANEEIRLMEGIAELLATLRDEAAGVQELDFGA